MPFCTHIFSRARKRAVTLIESVLFVSVSLGIMVGGIVFFQQASEARRIEQVVRNASTMIAGVRAMYRTQPSFAGLNNDIVYKAGLVPKTLNTSKYGPNRQIYNEFGRDTGATSESSGAPLRGAYHFVGAAADHFHMVITNISPGACMRLATFDSNGNSPLGPNVIAAWISQSWQGYDEDGSPVNAGTGEWFGDDATAAELVAACDHNSMNIQFRLGR